jgi:hypothetical protein
MIEVNEKAAVATAGDSKYAPAHPTSATELPETAVEKALVRKVDMHIIPLIILLYLFSFLDRGMSGSSRPKRQPWCIRLPPTSLTRKQLISAMQDYMAWKKSSTYKGTSIRSLFQFSSLPTA